MRILSYFKKKKTKKSFDEKLEEMLDQKISNDEIFKYIEDKVNTLESNDLNSYRPKMFMVIIKKGDDDLVRQVIKKYRIHLKDTDNKPIQQYIVEQIKSNNADVVNYFYEPERKRTLNDVTFSYTYTVRNRRGLSRLFIDRVYEHEHEGKLLEFATWAVQRPHRAWLRGPLDESFDPPYESNPRKTLRALRMAGAEGPHSRYHEALGCEVSWDLAVSELQNSGWPVLNELDEAGRTPLYCAARHNKIWAVRELLADGAKTEIKEHHKGRTPLYAAAAHGHNDVVVALLEKDASIDNVNSDGVSPLCIAASRGHIDVVRTLLKSKATIDLEAAQGQTALGMAVQNNHPDVVYALVEAMKEEEVPSLMGCRALYHAARMGNWLVLKALLDSYKIKKTPLILTNIFTRAIDSGRLAELANNNHLQIEFYSQTPLHLAAYIGHVNAVKALIDVGANKDSIRYDGLTPVFLASQNGHVDVVKALIEAGANLNPTTTTGLSPLYMAVLNEHQDVWELLIQAGADINQALTEDNTTPLWVAAYKGDLNLVKRLLNEKADANKARFNGKARLKSQKIIITLKWLRHCVALAMILRQIQA